MYRGTLQSNNESLQNIFNTINALPEVGGTKLPALDNPGTADDLLLNKQLINESGEIVKGAFTLEEELTEQKELFEQLEKAIDSLPNAAATSAGTCTLEIYHSANETINGIYYSSNNQYIYTTSQEISNVDVGKPILIDYTFETESSYDLEYPSLLNINVLVEDHDSEIMIIQCPAANERAYMYFYCVIEV